MNSNLPPQVLYIFSSLATIVGGLTIVFNGFLITVIVKTKSLQVLENTFVVSLVVVNFIVIAGFLVLGYVVVWNYNSNTRCRWLMSCGSYIISAALVQVVAMTMDKYIRILHPFQHIRICNRRNVILVTGFVHFNGLLSMLVSFFYFRQAESALCSTFFAYSKEILSITQTFIFIYICGIALLNIRILQISHRKKNQVQPLLGNNAQAQGVRGVKVLAVVVLFLFIFYFPNWMQMILFIIYEPPIAL